MGIRNINDQLEEERQVREMNKFMDRIGWSIAYVTGFLVLVLVFAQLAIKFNW